MARLHRPGERTDEELVPDFNWTKEVTVLVHYNSETDTVVIDRGPLGLTMVQAILAKALEEPSFSDEDVEVADDDD